MIGLPVLLLVVAQCSSDDVEVSSVLETSPDTIWESEIGAGFRKNVRSIEVKLSRAFGTTDTGSNVPHDLWLAQIDANLLECLSETVQGLTCAVTTGRAEFDVEGR